MINQFTENIKSGKNFAFTKFGDSELLCMDGREGRNGDNHPFSKGLCDMLNMSYDMLSRQPESYFAEWTGTWAELYPHRNVSFVEYETLLPTVHNPDLVGLFWFYKAIKEGARKKIFVGPARSRPVIELMRIDTFIEVPLYNCWEDRVRVHKEIAEAHEPGCIIMFSCTMLANVLIGDVYDGTVTTLDCGSAFDPYCDIQNRERQMTPLEAKRFFTDGTLPVRSTKENTYFVHIRNPRTGEYYSSYNDYFRLVHLSGFKECDLEQVDPASDNTYIFTLNFHGLNQEPIPDEYFPDGRSARYIHHQIERVNLIDERFDEIWFSDKSIPELRHPKARYVTLGGHQDFMEPLPDVQKQYDFSHMCYPAGRRFGMLEDMLKRGFSLAPAPIEWEEKNRVMQESKMGLALHQHGDSLDMIEPLRYTVFSCMKLPILAEKSKDFYPYEVFDYEMFLANPNIGDLQRKWEANWIKMTWQFTFERCVLERLNR
jgi:hypothetical protein